MKRDEIVTMLESLGACDNGPTDALPWVRSLPPETTLRQVWRLCERGDWLLWWLRSIGCDSHWLMAAKCACVRGVWPLLTDARSRRAVEVAELWSQGMASDEELAEARAAAYAAADAAAVSAYAASAAYAAAYAADATYATYATYAAAYAAYAAYAAASAYAAAVARKRALRSCARRVRRVVPWRVVQRTMREWRGKGGA